MNTSNVNNKSDSLDASNLHENLAMDNISENLAIGRSPKDQCIHQKKASKDDLNVSRTHVDRMLGDQDTNFKQRAHSIAAENLDLNDTNKMCISHNIKIQKALIDGGIENNASEESTYM